MKILHVFKSLWPGGAESLLCDLIRTASEGVSHEVAVVERGEPKLEQRVSDLGAPLHRQARRTRLGMALSSSYVTGLVRSRGIDVVHSHMPLTAGAARMAGVRAGVPCVHTEHSLRANRDRCSNAWNALTAPLQTDLVCVSEAIRADCRWSSERVHVIPNGVDTRRFRPLPGGRSAARAALGIGEDRLLVGNVANLRPPKALDVWLQAARRIAADCGERVEFVVVGEGPQRAELEAAAESVGLSGRVHWLGRRTDVEMVLRAFDVFLMSSRFEGFPVALLEAMASGVAVVSTLAGGVSEVVERLDQSCGAEIGDAYELARLAVRLLRDDERRAAHAAQGRDLVRERYELGDCVKAYEQVYRAAVAAGRGRRANHEPLAVR